MASAKCAQSPPACNYLQCQWIKNTRRIMISWFKSSKDQWYSPTIVDFYFAANIYFTIAHRIIASFLLFLADWRILEMVGWRFFRQAFCAMAKASSRFEVWASKSQSVWETKNWKEHFIKFCFELWTAIGIVWIEWYLSFFINEKFCRKLVDLAIYSRNQPNSVNRWKFRGTVVFCYLCRHDLFFVPVLPKDSQDDVFAVW